MVGSLRATHRFLVAVLVLAVVALYVVPFAAAAPAALPLIDHFDSTQGPLDAVLGTPAGSSVADANVLGGERDIWVTVLPGSLSSPAGMHVSVGSSLFSSSQDSGVFGQALVTYDGTDANPQGLNPTGLNHVDLTQGNTNNGFELTSKLNDLPIRITITVYTDGTSASSATITLPGGQASSAPPVTHYIEFPAFTQAAGASAPANFKDVGAIQMLIDGFNDASDLTIEDFAVSRFDWGDLPDASVGGPNFPTKYANNGPRHVIGSLFLGAAIDSAEPDGVPSTGANGDDLNRTPNDEDGVVRTPNFNWNAGANGGSIDVTVTGGAGCLSGWMDWNGNGSLLDGGENILSNVALTAGTHTLTFFVPAEPSGSYYARFRLYAPDEGETCTSTRTPTGRAVNGEVEDYQWSFTPTAVSLSSFSGSATSALPLASGVVASLAVVLLVVRRVLRG